MQELKSMNFIYMVLAIILDVFTSFKKKGLKPLAIIDKAKTGQFDGIKLLNIKILNL